MTEQAYRRPAAGTHPANLSPEYKSTVARSPSKPAVVLPQTLSEITGPLRREERLDAGESDHCGQCRACLDSCPTAAFPAPYRLDARRCISYLTIEHEGAIDREFRQALGNRIYGCDDCLAACPWNKFAQTAQEAAFLPRPELTAPALADLASLDDAGFRQRFAGTAIKRIGRDRFVRNVAYALGNSGAADAALPSVERLLEDPSPLVRGAAVWAFSQLAPTEFERRRGSTKEIDSGVRAEWEAMT